MLTSTIVDPSAQDANEFLEKHYMSKADKMMLLVLGDCLVDYQGRARSLLDWGERLVLIKQDGTVIVHQPVMREPVNWQPAGSNTTFRVHDNQLIVRSWHNRPPEKMAITFRGLKLVATSSLKDRASLVIAGMEADVVNQIICEPDMLEEGLRISKREKPVKSGMIDLFGYAVDHTPVVIEVKRSIATLSAVHQLRMYVSDVKKDVKEANVRGILCAPRVPDMVKKLLSDYGLEWREVKRTVMLPDDHQKTLSEFLKEKKICTVESLA